METRTLSVRISSKQDDYLLKQSKIYGVNRSALVRRIIDEFMIKNKERFLSREELLALRNVTNEINKIGININQIVHDYNSGFYNEKDKIRLCEYLDMTEQLLASIADKIKK